VNLFGPRNRTGANESLELKLSHAEALTVDRFEQLLSGKKGVHYQECDLPCGWSPSGAHQMHQGCANRRFSWRPPRFHFLFTTQRVERRITWKQIFGLAAGLGLLAIAARLIVGAASALALPAWLVAALERAALG
jgi:hypothetical protein